MFAIWDLVLVFFSLAGFDAAIRIKELKADDLSDLESFARTIPALISTYCTDKKITLDAYYRDKVHQIFLGLYASNSKGFQFHKGEVVLIIQVTIFVTHKVTRKGAEDDFSFFSDTNNLKPSLTVKTHLGEFFIMNSEDETFFGPLCMDKTPNIGK